jgi:hypothetical protein
MTKLNEKIASFKTETLPKWTAKVREAFTPNKGVEKSSDEEKRPRSGRRL